MMRKLGLAIIMQKKNGLIYFNIVEFVGLGKLDLVQILVLIFFFSPPLVNVLMAAWGGQLSYKQRALSAPHQTKIVDWFGPPHSFTVWHRPRLEWCWWCCWGGGAGGAVGSRWEPAQSGGKGDTAQHYIAVFPFSVLLLSI